MEDMASDVGMSASGDFSTTSVKRARSVAPLSEVGSRQKYRRTDPIINRVKEEASIQKVAPNELLGIVTQRINYHKNKDAFETGKSLAESKTDHQTLPLPAAAHLQVYNNLSRACYQRQIAILKNNGFKIFPSWKDVRSYESDRTPNVLPIISNGECLGIKTDYKSALDLTLRGIFRTMSCLPSPGTLNFFFQRWM